MHSTYITIRYVPNMRMDDHGTQKQCGAVKVEDGVLKVWSHEHSHNPTIYRAIPLAHILEYVVKEYR